MNHKKLCLLTIITGILSSVSFGQWDTLFSDDFNQSNGPLTEPWQFFQDTLFIQSGHVVAKTNEYGLAGFLANDSYESVAIESSFNFNQDDTEGRFQFFCAGVIDSTTTFGVMTKISHDLITLWQAFPETEILSIAYNFTLNTIYKMRLEYFSPDSLLTHDIMNETGTILDNFQVNSLVVPGEFSMCLFGIENGSGSDKYFDDILFQFTTPLSTEISNEIPITDFLLSKNYPNPFNPVTTISYQLWSAGITNLSIYDTKGELVEILVNGYQTVGFQNIQWDASKVSSGIYFYKLTSGNQSITNKMVLIK